MSRVTVLIPVRNTGRWLRETIASVQAQTFADWKLIAIDDGSTDNSAAILNEFAQKDPRITVVSRENRGLVATRNELLVMADTEFIAWLDSDDCMTANRLQLQLQRFDADPQLVWVGGALELVDPEKLPICRLSFPADHEAICKWMEKAENGCSFGTTLMRRETALKLGGFRYPFVIAEDYDLCLRMSEVGRVANIEEVVLLYRQHLGSTANLGRPQTYIFSKVVRALADERQKVGSDRLQRGEPLVIELGNLPSASETALETHRRWAWWALSSGNLATARKYAWQTMREQPLSLSSWKLLVCVLRGH